MNETRESWMSSVSGEREVMMMRRHSAAVVVVVRCVRMAEPVMPLTPVMRATLDIGLYKVDGIVMMY